MSETNPSFFGEGFRAEIKAAVREAFKEVMGDKGDPAVEPYVNAEQVAKFLGVEPAYVYRLARAGKIPSRKIGKYWKFLLSEIKKWADRKGH